MMIELNSRTVGLIFSLERECFTFGWPVAIVQKCNGIAPNAIADILIPKFPKDLLEGGHVELLYLKFLERIR
jgi:hypothetical protein